MSKTKHAGKKRSEEPLTYPNRRNQAGRTGLDPMDTYKEYGYMEGVFIRKLIRGQLRTQNTFYQFLMGIVGAACLLLVIGVTISARQNHAFVPGILCLFFPFAAAGVLLLYNLWLNVHP